MRNDLKAFRVCRNLTCIDAMMDPPASGCVEGKTQTEPCVGVSRGNSDRVVFRKYHNKQTSYVKFRIWDPIPVDSAACIVSFTVLTF